MSRITIPGSLQGKELFKFLIANKSALISQKKSMLKRTEAVCHSPMVLHSYAVTAEKAAGGVASDPTEDTGVLRVKVVANTAMWLDSQKDLLLRDNAKRSIRERKGLIPHIHDHLWEVTSEIGDVVGIYYQEIPLTELGINKAGTAQCLVFATDVRRDYNEKVYLRYKAGKIKQHSIGLQYVTIELAINDTDWEKEQDFWNKYIDQIINREEAEKDGYFWVVSEIKLMENSAVLFGSNILTPTLDSENKSSGTDNRPLFSTDTQSPSHESKADEGLMRMDKIAESFLKIKL